MSTKVWIAQCLCPQRHCILAASGEADDRGAAQGVEKSLRATLARLIEAEVINPWCGLCNARMDTWAYELQPTPWRSMAEADGPLKQSEREQAAIRAAWGDMPRSD